MKFSELCNAYMKSPRRYAYPLLVILALIAGYFSVTPLGTTGLHAMARVEGKDDRSKPITLPFKKGLASDNKDIWAYTNRFEHRPGYSRQFILYADDCWIEPSLNGEIIATADITTVRKDKNAHCDYNYNIKLDLIDYVREGPNIFTVRVQNKSGNTGLHFARAPSWLQIELIVVAVACVLGLCYLAGMRTGVFFVGAFFYYLFWLYYRDNYAYTNDLPGHLAYIIYIGNDFLSPYAYTQWESWHPPTYYYLMALVKHIGDMSGLHWITAVRLATIGIYMGYAAFAVKALRDASPAVDRYYYLGVYLVLFWPLSLLYATRVNNDILLYLTWTASYYFILRWYAQGRLRDMQLSLVMLGLSITVKTGAILNMGVVGGIMLYALVRRRWHLRDLLARRTLASLGFVLLCMLVNAGRIIHQQFTGAKDMAGMHLGGSGHYQMTWYRAFGFDLTAFLEWPFNKHFGEPTFLNYILKTALFGQHVFGLVQVAILVCALLLVFLLVAVLATAIVLHTRRRRWDDIMPYLIGLFVPLLGILTFTWVKDLQVCQEMRFGYPMMLALFLLYTTNLRALRDMRGAALLSWIGIATALAIPLGGMLVFVSMFWGY